MARASYTPEQRAEALELYREHGPAAASRRTGIPTKTIASWARRSGVQTDAPARTAAAVEAAALRWQERKQDLADAIGVIVAQAVERVGEALPEANAQQAATVAAILTDKAQLLTGEATERGDHRIQTDATSALEAGRARVTHLRTRRSA